MSPCYQFFFINTPIIACFSLDFNHFSLGIAYQFGYGVEKDLKRAEELFDEGTKYAIDRDNCYCKLGNQRAKELFYGLKKDGKL